MNTSSAPPQDRASSAAPVTKPVLRLGRAVSRIGALGKARSTPEPTVGASLTDADRRRKAPKLRLVGTDAVSQKQVVKPAIAPPQHEPITDTTDARWVLAVRTAEQLEGTILRPERRESLLRLGKVFGLTPFDTNLVIAIVQDQARRGHAPAYCPAAGEPQLRMVPPPRRRPWSLRRWLTLGACVATFTAAELAVLAWYFGG